MVNAGEQLLNCIKLDGGPAAGVTRWQVPDEDLAFYR